MAYTFKVVGVNITGDGTPPLSGSVNFHVTNTSPVKQGIQHFPSGVALNAVFQFTGLADTNEAVLQALKRYKAFAHDLQESVDAEITKVEHAHKHRHSHKE